MNRKQLRRHDLHYLMSFIDFAFMVIIIFISLLSVAYFDPPGSAGVKRQKALYTVKDVEELQKLGLTPAQVKELLVVRRHRMVQERKLQDIAVKKSGTEKKDSNQTDAVTAKELAETKKTAVPESRWLKENVSLRKKLTLLESQIAQMKKQVSALQEQKNQVVAVPVMKTIMEKSSTPPESSIKKKRPFGGHEFLDLRRNSK